MQILPGSPAFLALSLLLYFVLVNCLTFLLFQIDACRVETDERRIPESMLLLLSAFGGTPAAKLASRWVDRENRNECFSGTLNLIVAAHLMTAVTLNTTKGQEMVLDLGHSTAQLVGTLASVQPGQKG
jgi:uncharacterized membrane protein YsdA (DUF1294 family)